MNSVVERGQSFLKVKKMQPFFKKAAFQRFASYEEDTGKESRTSIEGPVAAQMKEAMVWDRLDLDRFLRSYGTAGGSYMTRL